MRAQWMRTALIAAALLLAASILIALSADPRDFGLG